MENEPVLVDIKDVTKINAGDAHSLFLTYAGKVKACGDNSRGQCALPDSKPRSSRPKTIQDLKGVDIVSIDCRTTSLAMSSERSIFIWGPMAEKDLFAPVWVQDLDSIKITEAAVAEEEILIVENRSVVWKLYWDDDLQDIKLDRLSNVRKRFINKISAGPNFFIALDNRQNPDKASKQLTTPLSPMAAMSNKIPRTAERKKRPRSRPKSKTV